MAYRRVDGHDTQITRRQHRTHRNHGPWVRGFARCRHAKLPACDFLNVFLSVCACVQGPAPCGKAAHEVGSWLANTTVT